MRANPWSITASEGYIHEKRLSIGGEIIFWGWILGEWILGEMVMGYRRKQAWKKGNIWHGRKEKK